MLNRALPIRLLPGCFTAGLSVNCPRHARNAEPAQRVSTRATAALGLMAPSVSICGPGIWRNHPGTVVPGGGCEVQPTPGWSGTAQGVDGVQAHVVAWRCERGAPTRRNALLGLRPRMRGATQDRLR